jgi:hypothetical protein
LSLVLVVDFFVVLVFLVWFLLGAALQSTNAVVLERFQDIFNPVVVPCLTLLMVGSIASAVLALLPKGEPMARVEECAGRGNLLIARRTVAESDVAAACGIAGDAASHRVASGVDAEARATVGDAAAVTTFAETLVSIAHAAPRRTLRPLG